MVFLSEDFWFNDISNKSMGVDLVTFEKNTFNIMGTLYNKTVNLDGSIFNNPYYKEKTEDTEEVVLNMLLVDEQGQAKAWDHISVTEIVEWLVTDDFKPFVSKDDEEATYYFKATKIVKYFTNDNIGYLEVTFKPYDNNCYHRVKYKGMKLNINNPSNHNDFYYPLIRVKENTEISNLTTNEEPLIIETDIPATIDCNMLTVVTDNGENIISKCNRKWLRLAKGVNKIQSNSEIIIECNFPIMR